MGMRWIFGREKHSVPTWKYVSEGIIWRLFPFGTGYIIGEDRDTDRKTVSFFCLDEVTGRPRWNGLRCAEQWWVSMEAIHNDVLILHEYAAPDMPDHKKIHAVDTSSGSVMWVNDDVKFLFCHAHSLYAAKDTYDQRLFFEIDLMTGKLLREVNSQHINEIRQHDDLETAGGVVFPAVIRHVTAQYPLIGKIPGITDEDAQVETIDSDSHFVTAVCRNVSTQQPQRSYQQELYVYRKADQALSFSDTMNQNLTIPVPDMFFVKGNFIYYIKEKSTLCAFQFTGEHRA
jgi:hypothetical protein